MKFKPKTASQRGGPKASAPEEDLSVEDHFLAPVTSPFAWMVWHICIKKWIFRKPTHSHLYKGGEMKVDLDKQVEEKLAAILDAKTKEREDQMRKRDEERDEQMRKRDEKIEALMKALNVHIR